MSELIYGRHAVLEALRLRRRIYRLWLEGVDGSQGSIVQRFLSRPRRLKFPRGIKGGRSQARPTAPRPGRCARSRRLSSRRTRRHSLGSRRAPCSSSSTTSRTRRISALFPHSRGDGGARRDHPGTAPLASRPAVSKRQRQRSSSCRLQVTNLDRTIDTLKAQNIWITGLDTRPDAPLLEKSALTGAVAVVVGSEAEGISRLTREKCDFWCGCHVRPRREFNAAVMRRHRPVPGAPDSRLAADGHHAS